MRRIARVLGVAGVVLALAGCWAVPGQNANRTAHNAFETELTPATVAELTEAWVSEELIPLVASDPVVSSSGVVVEIGGCVTLTLEPTDGSLVWLAPPPPSDCGEWPGPGVVVARADSGPFVVADRVLTSGYTIVDFNAPRPPDYGIFGGVSHRDVATGDDLPDTTGPGMLLAAVRDDIAVATTYRVAWTVPQPGFPSIQRIVRETVVGSITDPAARRTVSVVGTETATLGPDAFYASGSGTLSTTPGDGAPDGQALRAYSESEPRPGCGTGGTKECPLWATPIDGTAPPAVIDADLDGTTVFVGTSAGSVYSIDAATGAVLWTASVGARVTASPALAGGVLYVPTADGRLVAVDTAVGTVLWEASTGSGITEQPAVAGGVVYTSSAGGSLDAFAAAGCGDTTCTALWSAETGRSITGAPAVSGGRLYVGTDDGRVIAYALP